MKNLKDFKLTKLESKGIFGGNNELTHEGNTWQKTYAKSDKDKTGPYWEDTVD